MSSKRIDLLINSLRGGGAEKVFVTVANGLSEKGYDVRIVLLNLDNAVYFDKLNSKISVNVLEKKHARDSVFSLLNYIKQKNVKKLLIFNYELTLIVLFLNKIFNLKLNIISRNINTLSVQSSTNQTFKSKISTILSKVFYKNVDHVIAQSMKMAEDLHKNYNFNKDRISVINNPVDPILSEKAIHSPKPLDIVTNEVLFVGRLTKQKNIPHILEAIKIASNIDNNISLRIVGEGELLEEIVSISKELGIFDKIIITKFTKNVHKYYNNAKVTILASHYEGFPNVLVESITMGTPVISYDSPSGPSEIIKDYHNGILVEYMNVNQLANAIIRSINYNWEIDKIKATAEVYQKDIILEKYEQVLFNKR